MCERLTKLLRQSRRQVRKFWNASGAFQAETIFLSFRGVGCVEARECFGNFFLLKLWKNCFQQFNHINLVKPSWKLKPFELLK